MIAAKKVSHRLLVLVSVLVASELSGFAQQGPVHSSRGMSVDAAGSETILLPAERRVVFDATPFSVRSVVPYWNRGYLISRDVETVHPGVSNVRLYDLGGNKVRQAAIWFPGTQRLLLPSAAVTLDGRIVAVGVAERSDGTRASFIALTDVSGSITNVIQTNPFHPSHVCVAPDNTVWSFGSFGYDEMSRPIEGETLRHYDFQKGLIGAYVPRSSFSSDSFPPDANGGRNREVYFRCSTQKLVIYSGVANEYLEMDFATQTVKRFRVDRSAFNLPINGFALTATGEVFASLGDFSGATGLRGLFHLQLDSNMDRVRWLPVPGATAFSKKPGIVTWLGGADDDGLVFMQEGDDVGVRWARLVNHSASIH